VSCKWAEHSLVKETLSLTANRVVLEDILHCIVDVIFAHGRA